MTAAPAKNQTIKLQTNIPLIGVVQYCDYTKSKNPEYGDQIKLKGTFDGHGEASVYLPGAVSYNLLQDGYMEESGTDRFGNTAYKWLRRGKVQILKREQGQKKHTTVAPYTDGSPAVQQAEREESDDSKGEAIRQQWVNLYLNYKRCVDMVQAAWPENTPAEVLGAGAHCLFIEANKRNLPPPPKREVQA